MLAELTPADLREAIREARPHSDIPEAYFEKIGEEFIEAHTRSPRGLSIEVGTRAGGSALLFLHLLEKLYRNEPPPQLWTIDPYGGKPYHGGDVKGYRPYWNNDVYLSAKKVLAPFPNHVHWMLRSLDFLELVREEKVNRYWHDGVAYNAKGDIAFAFLDGEHDRETIKREVQYLTERGLSPILRPNGTIVIDNVDVDPTTIPWLFEYGHTAVGVSVSVMGPFAVIYYRKDEIE